MTVFLIWILPFDSLVLELCKNTNIQPPLQATEWQSLGMAVLQNLP